MAKLQSTTSMLVITSCLTLAIMGLVNLTAPDRTKAPSLASSHPTVSKLPRQRKLFDISAHAADSDGPQKKWAASATGRIETGSGEHRLSALQPRRIDDVLVATHDKAKKGDVLVVLDDKDLYAKWDSAFAEVEVRVRERAEEEATGLALERQDAEDAWFDAERELFQARLNLDRVVVGRRNGTLSEANEQKARERLKTAKETALEKRNAYDNVVAKPDMPKPTRLDTGLTQARADLALIENEIQKTRIRAPFDGEVLNVWAKVGEVAAPSANAPLILFGDKSTMRVRAELEERDVVHVRVGQKVVVSSDAYPGKEFIGKVTSLGGALGARNIASRGPRRPSDIDVLEVTADLGPQPLLLPGMRVDVFFANDETAKAD